MKACTHYEHRHSGVCLRCKNEAKRAIHRETLEVLTNDE